MNKALAFTLTDKPMPPQPPAQTGKLASDAADKLPGTPDNAVGEVINRLNRGLNPGILLPGGVQRVLPRAVPGVPAPRP